MRTNMDEHTINHDESEQEESREETREEKHARRCKQHSDSSLAVDVMLTQERMAACMVWLWFVGSGILMMSLFAVFFRRGFLSTSESFYAFAIAIGGGVFISCIYLSVQGIKLMYALRRIEWRETIWSTCAPLVTGAGATVSLLTLPFLINMAFALVVAIALLSVGQYAFAHDVIKAGNMRKLFGALKRQNRVWLYTTLPLLIFTGCEHWFDINMARLLQNPFIVAVVCIALLVQYWSPFNLVMACRDGKHTAERIMGITLGGSSLRCNFKGLTTVKTVNRYDGTLGTSYLNQISALEPRSRDDKKGKSNQPVNKSHRTGLPQAPEQSDQPAAPNAIQSHQKLMDGARWFWIAFGILMLIAILASLLESIPVMWGID